MPIVNGKISPLVPMEVPQGDQHFLEDEGFQSDTFLLVKATARFKGGGLGDGVKFFVPFGAIPMGRATPLPCVPQGGLNGFLNLRWQFPHDRPLPTERDGCRHCRKKKSPRQEEAANRFLDVRYNHKAFRWEKSSEAGA